MLRMCIVRESPYHWPQLPRSPRVLTALLRGLVGRLETSRAATKGCLILLGCVLLCFVLVFRLACACVSPCVCLCPRAWSCSTFGLHKGGSKTSWVQICLDLQNTQNNGPYPKVMSTCSIVWVLWRSRQVGLDFTPSTQL